ncbi:hypothetical protein CFP56_031556 [Quercus suber]|uniref:Uncharacterized protein n=1 Tax=Quercus suber TaxID=58331 RepID=A0AAW0JKH5_QUESU
MTLDMATSASIGPASEAVSQTVEVILEIVVAANDVLVKKDSFKELATYLERIVPILKELNRKNLKQCYRDSQPRNKSCKTADSGVQQEK